MEISLDRFPVNFTQGSPLAGSFFPDPAVSQQCDPAPQPALSGHLCSSAYVLFIRDLVKACSVPSAVEIIGSSSLFLHSEYRSFDERYRGLSRKKICCMGDRQD